MLKFFEKKQYQLTVNGYPPVQLKHKETILNGAIRSNIDFPHSCKAGGCAACKCKLVSGKVKELTDKSYLLSKEELKQNIILGCQSIPKSNIIIELPNNSEQQECTGTIIGLHKLTHDISEVVIAVDTAIQYRAGQFAQLSTLDRLFPQRSYSFAHAKALEINGRLCISFFVREIPHGKMSKWLLSEQSQGNKVNIKASFGDFHLRQSDAPMICIAGGSGLAPLISILEQSLLLSPKEPRSIILLMGARSQSDLYYQKEIEAIKKQWHGSFTYLPVLSQEPEDSNWQGARGMVTDYLDYNIAESLIADAHGYFCGPPAMIDIAINKMLAKGADKNHLYFDKFLDQGR